MRIRGPRIGWSTAVLVIALVGVSVLAGCDSSPEATPVTRARGHASLYVALGGDDVYGGRTGLTTAWPQLLFRTSLPITTTFVNLAGRRAGVADVLRQQVDAARTLRPDLVTITVSDDAVRGTDPAVVGSDLDAVVRRLRTGTTTKVLVGTVPPDAAAPEVVTALNAEITRVATAAGATVVDLGSVRSTDPTVRSHQVARAFAAAL